VLLLSAELISGCASSKKTTEELASKKEEKKTKFGPYNEVITDEAQTDEGLFRVHKVDGKYYYEIPDTLLNEEMLLVSRIASTPKDLSFGGAGMKARSQQVVRWQKKNKKILLRKVSHESIADENNPIYKSVRNNNF